MPEDSWFKLAILYDENDPLSPSNKKAIIKFQEAALRRKVYCSIIDQDCIDMVKYFDGLFIRSYTHPKSYSYEFAKEAENLKIPVIDDTTSIIMCSNKIIQNEIFVRNNIPHPSTIYIERYKWEEKAKSIKLPCIIKIPDSSFCNGVFKAEDSNVLHETLEFILDKKFLIVQDFIETKFDWRVIVLNGEVISVLKYYIIEGDYRIVKYDNGRTVEGKFEGIKIEDTDKEIIDLSLKICSLIGEGLYGVDIKEKDGHKYVIEVNDNPNIDHGIEDVIYGNKVYNSVINYFVNKFIHRNCG